MDGTMCVRVWMYAQGQCQISTWVWCQMSIYVMSTCAMSICVMSNCLMSYSGRAAAQKRQSVHQTPWNPPNPTPATQKSSGRAAAQKRQSVHQTPDGPPSPTPAAQKSSGRAAAQKCQSTATKVQRQSGVMPSCVMSSCVTSMCVTSSCVMSSWCQADVNLCDVNVFDVKLCGRNLCDVNVRDAKLPSCVMSSVFVLCGGFVWGSAGEEGGRRKEEGGANQKTRTPHVNVGKNVTIAFWCDISIRFAF